MPVIWSRSRPETLWGEATLTASDSASTVPERPLMVRGMLSCPPVPRALRVTVWPEKVAKPAVMVAVKEDGLTNSAAPTGEMIWKVPLEMVAPTVCSGMSTRMVACRVPPVMLAESTKSEPMVAEYVMLVAPSVGLITLTSLAAPSCSK